MWFDCTQWHCSHFVSFHNLISVEAVLRDASAPMIDFKEWLDTHSADVQLLLLFLVEQEAEVFHLLDKAHVWVIHFLWEWDNTAPKANHALFF